MRGALNPGNCLVLQYSHHHAAVFSLPFGSLVVEPFCTGSQANAPSLASGAARSGWTASSATESSDPHYADLIELLFRLRLRFNPSPSEFLPPSFPIHPLSVLKRTDLITELLTFAFDVEEVPALRVCAYSETSRIKKLAPQKGVQQRPDSKFNTAMHLERVRKNHGPK